MEGSPYQGLYYNETKWLSLLAVQSIHNINKKNIALKSEAPMQEVRNGTVLW